MNNLYLVIYEKGDGDNRDLVVCAETPDFAIALWRDYIQETLEEPMSGVFPDHVFQFPRNPTAVEGVIGWNTPEGMNVVWESID